MKRDRKDVMGVYAPGARLTRRAAALLALVIAVPAGGILQLFWG